MLQESPALKTLGNVTSLEMKSLTVDPKKEQAPTRDFPSGKALPEQLPLPKEVNVHPSKSGGENASLYFVGNATTILYDFPVAGPLREGPSTDIVKGMGRT